MKLKQIVTAISAVMMISGTAIASEPTIDFAGITFTRTQFIQSFTEGAKLNGTMVSAEVFFDYFLQAQGNGLVAITPPTQPQPVASEPGELKEVTPVVLETATLFTNDELLILIETAPLHQDTRSARELPSRRITDTELNTWIEEYQELGGINAFELEVVRLINGIRAEHGLHPLAICPQISMAARFHSQEMLDLDYFAHQSPHHDGAGSRMRLFGNNQPLGENINGGASSPQRPVDGWMNSPGHRAMVLNATARYIGIGTVHSDEWSGAGRTTAKFAF